ncbi:MAG: porin [bacterium]|nr:porin [bacterium]
MRKVTLITILGVLLFSLTVIAQEKSSLDEQLKSYLHQDFFKLNILLQSEGRFSFEDDDFQGGRTFSAANARVSLRGNLDGGFFYRIYIDAAPQPGLLDAYAGYKANDGFSLAVGAMKPRQTLDYIPNPGEHNFVDRATMTGLLVGSREIGVSATGDIGNFYYYAGLFNGNRLNSNNNNKFYGIGRLQYTIHDLLPGYVQLAVSGSHGNSEGTRSGSNGPWLRGNRTIVGSDVEIESNGFYFAAEYLRGELETADLPDINEIISGYYLTGGYQIMRNTMLFCRWQSWCYKEQGTLEKKATLGTNIDFTDYVGLVLNFDAYMPDEGDNKYGASFIFQVQF